MIYTQQNINGRLVPALHTVRAVDATEIADGINLRRRLTYQQPQDFSGVFAGGLSVRRGPISVAVAPPIDNLRRNIADCILGAPAGSLGGSPPTPAAMQWLWPAADADENAPLVSGIGGVAPGSVGLVQRLNATADWTDPTLTPGLSPVRAVHINELRQSLEWLTRGRWELPIYWQAGLLSTLPDTTWFGGQIARDATGELRSVGFAMLRTSESQPRGLVGVTARAGSFIEVTASVACQIELRRVLRPLDFDANMPTWNEHDPAASLAWTSPGACGSGDSVAVGQLTLAPDTPAAFSGPAVAAALQAMIDGAEQSFLIRRLDSGPDAIDVAARVVVEWDA
jgi:hypothetical protein